MTRYSSDDATPPRSAAEELRDLIDPPSLRQMREMMQPSVVEQALETRRLLATMGDRNLVEDALAARLTLQQFKDRNLVADALAARRTLEQLKDQQLAGEALATRRMLFDRQLLAIDTMSGSMDGYASEGTRARLAGLFGSISELDRMRSQLWASGVYEQSQAHKALYSGTEFARVYAEATSLINQPGAAEARGILAGIAEAHSEFAATRAKLSMLAGAHDLFGFEARASIEARAALLGSWHTRPDLPQRFWRDPAMRARRYAEAEVDAGLVETDAGEALQIVITSGFAAGVQVEGVSTALIAFGDLGVTIEAKGSRSTAYHVLTAFEERLRRFIEVKMHAAYGPQWFKHQVDGKIADKAKRARVTAYKNGEPEAPLIDFTDLGELIAIILRGDNWTKVFEPVFVNRTRFDIDAQTLIAVRRPTMHARSVDGVRLVELIIAAQRLSEQMQRDGCLIAAAQAEL